MHCTNLFFIFGINHDQYIMPSDFLLLYPQCLVSYAEVWEWCDIENVALLFSSFFFICLAKLFHVLLQIKGEKDDIVFLLTYVFWILFISVATHTQRGIVSVHRSLKMIKIIFTVNYCLVFYSIVKNIFQFYFWELYEQSMNKTYRITHMYLVFCLL